MFSFIQNLSWFIVIPIFIILFTIIRQVIKKSEILPEPFDLVVSVCVTLLCVMSMFELGASKPTQPPEKVIETQVETVPVNPRSNTVEIILLPYAVLGFSILLLLLVALLGKHKAKLRKLFLKSSEDRSFSHKDEERLRR